MDFDGLWLILTDFEGFWWILTAFDGVWRTLMDFDDLLIICLYSIALTAFGCFCIVEYIFDWFWLSLIEFDDWFWSGFFFSPLVVVVPTYRRVTTHSRLSLTHAYEGSCQLDIKKDSTDGLYVVHGSSENPQWVVGIFRKGTEQVFESRLMQQQPKHQWANALQ